MVSEVTFNSVKDMICCTTIPSTSNKLNNLLVNENSQYSYTNKEFNDKTEEMINVFSAHITQQMKEIHHPALLQEWKLILDDADYIKIINSNNHKFSEKWKYIVLIVMTNGQHK